MFKLLLLVILMSWVLAEAEDDAHAEIEFLKTDLREGGFDYEFATSNHIYQHAQGDELGNINGEFKWLTPEGKVFSLKYIADDFGYRPVSEWIPTPPPIPKGILKGLEYIQAHTKDNGGYHYRV